MCADIAQNKFLPISQERFDKIVDEMVADMKKQGKPIITPAIAEGELRQRGTFEKDGKPTDGYNMTITESMQKDFITRVNEELNKSKVALASPPLTKDSPSAPDIHSPLLDNKTIPRPERPSLSAQDPYGGGTPFLRPEDVEAAIKQYGLQPLGIRTPQELDNVAAALTLKSQKDGLTGVDAVMRGNNGHVIAYQGDPASETVKRASVDIEQAKLQPAEKSLAEMTAPPTLQREAPQPARTPAL